MIIDVAKPKQWWTEQNFVFNGIKSTKYIWPSDRMIVFGDPKSFIVPTFSIKLIFESNVFIDLDAFINSNQNKVIICSQNKSGELRIDEIENIYSKPTEEPHIHVIEYENDGPFGIFACRGKLPVTTNFSKHQMSACTA